MTQGNSRYRQSAAVSIRLQQRAPQTVQVLASAESQLLLNANEKRAGFSIDNRSSAQLYLSYEEEASESNSFMVMAPYSFLLLDHNLMIGSAICGVWALADGYAQVTEYV
jgi:hypothetical protein